MGAKIANFFEQHIEKVVLALVGLVCIWLFITRVLISPNAVSYDNKKFNPSEIDKYILQQQAKDLDYALKQPPQLASAYVSKLNGPLEPNNPIREAIYGDLQSGFDGLLASAISGVDTRWSIPLPHNIATAIGGDKQYNLPVTDGVIGEVKDVAVEYIRAAAYVPTLPVTEEIPYENAVPQPNDIDLVSVEAKFDVAQLYKTFQENFAGEDVRQQWRDPCLAVPVFASVQLQRQELISPATSGQGLTPGTGPGANQEWSDWQDVPRSKIDHRRRMFEIIEEIENLPPGGIKVRLLQFNDPEVRMNLLQPQAYQIASANQEWFPPTLHKKFLELQKKEKLEQKRDEIETKKQEKQQQLDQKRGVTGGTALGTARPGTGTYYQGSGDVGALSGQTGLRPRSGRVSGRTGRTDTGRYDDMALYGDTGLAGGRQRRPRTRGPESDIQTEYMMEVDSRAISMKPSASDVYYEYQAILLSQMTDLAKMREPLTFWAHDDTVQPGKKYRYRIRLGVFNPIAGTNQLAKPNKSMQNQAILWSKFSEATEQVVIPGRLYFFAKDVQEAAKKVTVQISRYLLGYWRSEDFQVRHGEAIGKVVESEAAGILAPATGRGTPAERRGLKTPAQVRGLIADQFGLPTPQEQVEPESIDYSTGAVLVDAVAVTDWAGSGNLHPRHYFDMLYSFDGANIERMPIQPGNWSPDLLSVYNQINRLQREPKEPLRAWDSRVGGPRRGLIPGAPQEGMEEYYDEYDLMLEEMMGQQMGPQMRRY